MKRFLIKIIVLGLVFFIFDKLFIVVENLSAKNEVDRRLEMLINGGINKEIIVIGSSRGARDIIAGRLEVDRYKSAYNLSYPGSDIEFHLFILKALLKFNPSPNLILLTVDDDEELLPSESIKFRYDKLYPLVKYNFIREVMAERGEKNRFLSKYFVLHRLNITNFNFKKKSFSSLDTVLACGSMPISFQKRDISWNYEDENKDYTIPKEDIKKLSAFKDFIEICKNRNIGLVIVFPPNFKALNSRFVDRIKTLVGRSALSFKYNPQNRFYKDQTYYHDPNHLNLKGAQMFTDEISQFLSTQSYFYETPSKNN